MPSILIQFDEASLRALDRIALVAKRERAEFIRKTVKEAIRKQVFAKIREGYLQQPDIAETDDWSTAEEFVE